jgi:hypothetical protein
MSEFAEQLRELRHPPESAMASELFVARVMAACSEEVPVAAAVTRRPARSLLTATALLAAAAAAVLALGRWSVPPTIDSRPGEDGLVARGVAAARHSATVQAFVGRAAPGSAARLLEGAELGAGDGILVRYSNPGTERVYLMVFALDARHEVHWLHPAYLDAASDPSSLELRQGVMGQALEEVAEPENPAPGALRVYALLSSQPLTVKAVEAALATKQRPVHELFAEAEVEEWRCTWRAP